MRKEEFEDTRYVKIKNTDGQAFINQFKKNLQVIYKKMKVLHEDNFILFPILDENEIVDILKNQQFEYEIIKRKGIIRNDYKFKSLKEALKNILPESLFHYIPNSYDIIGDIAILEFDKFNDLDAKIDDSLKIIIADALISVNKKVKTI